MVSSEAWLNFMNLGAETDRNLYKCIFFMFEIVSKIDFDGYGLGPAKILLPGGYWRLIGFGPRPMIFQEAPDA